VTLHAVAAHRGIPLHRVDVDALGVVGRPPEGGGYRFTSIELSVEIETDPNQVQAAEQAAALAEKACLVSRSLDTPVQLTLRVTSPAGVAVAAR
jgi:organic hydroperoxide reductase OsmC/OhrA